MPGYAANERRGVLFNGVSPNYFKAMGTPLLAGRDIADTDRAGAPDVIIVNEAFAKKYFNGENPIGRTFTIVGFNERFPTRHMEIIGLVADAKYQRLREEAQPIMYGALAQERAAQLRRARGDPHRPARRSTRATPSSQAIAGVHKDIAVDLKRLDEDLGANVLQERLVATLSGFFGGLALAARRARPLRRDVVHGDAPPQRDRHPHGARRRAAQGDRPGAHERRADHDRRA